LSVEHTYRGRLQQIECDQRVEADLQERALSIDSEEVSFKRAKKDLLASMPATVKDAVSEYAWAELIGHRVLVVLALS
jgi:hypothetical protein